MREWQATAVACVFMLSAAYVIGAIISSGRSSDDYAYYQLSGYNGIEKLVRVNRSGEAEFVASGYASNFPNGSEKP